MSETSAITIHAATPLRSEYLTPTQLAVELGVSQKTLIRWHNQRSGPPRTMVGRTVLYRREAVRRWLHDNEIAPLGAGGPNERASER